MQNSYHVLVVRKCSGNNILRGSHPIIILIVSEPVLFCLSRCPPTPLLLKYSFDGLGVKGGWHFCFSDGRYMMAIGMDAYLTRTWSIGLLGWLVCGVVHIFPFILEHFTSPPPPFPSPIDFCTTAAVLYLQEEVALEILKSQYWITRHISSFLSRHVTINNGWSLAMILTLYYSNYLHYWYI